MLNFKVYIKGEPSATILISFCHSNEYQRISLISLRIPPPDSYKKDINKFRKETFIKDFTNNILLCKLRWFQQVHQVNLEFFIKQI